ncbi:hypothetical protein RRG08_062268 [Elysia crispata]|uniref:Uncharacterized protein n=1 Tax=Elysia crispata TaxID=231223 RepID=A0AAE1CY83_9GAST|nr:hypothetical protein RRG08_062268 [Elysia crispata]
MSLVPQLLQLPPTFPMVLPLAILRWADRAKGTADAGQTMYQSVGPLSRWRGLGQTSQHPRAPLRSVGIQASEIVRAADTPGGFWLQ